MDKEAILHPSDKEPVTTEEVLSQLNAGSDEIAQALRVRAEQRSYNPAQVKETLDYLTGKVELLAQGLLPSDDHTFLSGVIDDWFGMAHTSARYSNEIEPSDRVIRRAVDAIHGTMVVNKLISDEASTKIRERWPEQVQAAD